MLLLCPADLTCDKHMDSQHVCTDMDICISILTLSFNVHELVNVGR